MRVAHVPREPEGPHRASRYSPPSPTAVSTADLHATLSCVGRRVALRFRNRPGEVIFAEVVAPLHRNIVALVPWGVAGEFVVNVRDLKSVMVALVLRHEEFKAICQRQRAWAREGRFS